MQTFDVAARCDVFCDWWYKPPRYRLYVGDELFAERTWIWEAGLYLDEHISIKAPPGRYHVRLEMVDPEHSKIKIKNLRIDSGSAIIANDGSIQVYVPENSNDT